jgi:DNA topoisomerase I
VQHSEDSQTAARAAGLHWVSSVEGGYARVRHGRGFTFTDGRGHALRDRKTLARVRSLAIPPAWRDVWISDDPAGHVQACGRDARGRKQCLYHAKWREARDEAKYSRMREFGRALPALRAQVARDLRCSCLCEDAVIAAIVTLLDRGQLRIGCDEYSKENGSHGACTLTDSDVRVKGSTIRFRFVGKSGVKQTVEVKHARLAKVIAKCRAMRGPRLFQYEDEDGVIRAVTAKAVNEYLRAHTSGEISAKDFRTWHASALCKKLLPKTPGKTETERKRELKAVIEQVAEQLGNTPTVCRKSYIDPELMETYLRVEAKAKKAEAKTAKSAGSGRAARRSARGRGRPSTGAHARGRRRPST